MPGTLNPPAEIVVKPAAVAEEWPILKDIEKINADLSKESISNRSSVAELSTGRSPDYKLAHDPSRPSLSSNADDAYLNQLNFSAV